jgi:GNAT superfamily N-acetyltransferase
MLARAFSGYPLMRYFFECAEGDMLEHIRGIYYLTCLGRMLNSDPVKGIVRDGRLLAVACVDSPERKPWPESMEPDFAAFAMRAGDEAIARLGSYAELTTSHRPAVPHYYLTCIGVLPEAQGQGLGRVLLENVYSLSTAHPTSTGVGLDTETPGNVRLYEHCGYHVNGESELGGVNIWYMFRPDAPFAP